MTNLIVRCIKQGGNWHITEGTEYAVLHETVLNYKVFNDVGNHVSYSKTLFEVVRLPRQHSEEIRAWADGAIIQYRFQGSSSGEWHDSELNEPKWLTNYDYRVKPVNPNAARIRELENELINLEDTVRCVKIEIKQLIK